MLGAGSSGRRTDERSKDGARAPEQEKRPFRAAAISSGPQRRDCRRPCPASVRKERARSTLVTDITEQLTREGKVYCAVVLDAFSRRVVGWSIDGQPTAALVTNALGMAIEQRRPRDGTTVVHSDQGTQCASCAFTKRAVDSGLLPSMGSVGDCYDNAMVESFWSRMQVELLNRRRWQTRTELANAIFEYLEILHNRQRRHSSLGMLSPVEYELRNAS